MPKTLKTNTGLTMTELTLVVIIVALMVALGVPQYQNTVRDAHQKTARLNLNLVRSAQDSYFDLNNGTYYASGSLDDLNTNLKLGITPGALAYSCTTSAGDYDCRAKYPASGAEQWHCQITRYTGPDCT